MAYLKAVQRELSVGGYSPLASATVVQWMRDTPNLCNVSRTDVSIIYMSYAVERYDIFVVLLMGSTKDHHHRWPTMTGGVVVDVSMWCNPAMAEFIGTLLTRHPDQFVFDPLYNFLSRAVDFVALCKLFPGMVGDAKWLLERLRDETHPRRLEMAIIQSLVRNSAASMRHILDTVPGPDLYELFLSNLGDWTARLDNPSIFVYMFDPARYEASLVLAQCLSPSILRARFSMDAHRFTLLEFYQISHAAGNCTMVPEFTAALTPPEDACPR